MLADPLWTYTTWDNDKVQGWTGKHYSTLTVEDICKVPVRRILTADAALFLWATPPCLKEAIMVMAAWGFTYKTVAFVWVKLNKNNGQPVWGLGHWTRANAELCLLGTRGSPKRVSKAVSQVIFAPRRQHSRKPDEARHRIVELMGDLPRIELFAREQAPGWDVWGNEIENSITMPQ